MDNKSIKKIICLMGPTATGKTDLAVELVKRLPCDIISVDSAMVYRGMDIGTAKPSPEILRIAPHRLINIRDPVENYSAADFCIDAKREIENIFGQQRIPLLVGGTMLYFRALQQGLASMPAADPQVRKRIEKQAEQFGWQALHEQLKKIDPFAAERIHPNDPQRIQRALEIYELTGKPISELHEGDVQFENPDWEFINLALLPANRAELHEKIAQRFNHMLAQGLIEEVKKLFARGDLDLNKPAIRAVGYQQVWRYLAGEYDYNQMCEKAIVATRQLAKRQITWLRTWPDTHYFNVPQVDLLDQILSYLLESRALGISR